MEGSKKWAWDRVLTLCGDWRGLCKALVPLASVSSLNASQLSYRLGPGEMVWSGVFLWRWKWHLLSHPDSYQVAFVSNHLYSPDTFYKCQPFLALPSPQKPCLWPSQS